jgi:hypothetical protein
MDLQRFLAYVAGKRIGLKMYLESQEIVIENGMLSSHNRIYLTNKRLVFEEGQGSILTFWKPYHQLLLSDIEEIYIEESFILDTIKIKLKKGPIMRVQFKPVANHMPRDGIDNFVNCSTAERWVHTINVQLGKCT